MNETNVQQVLCFQDWNGFFIALSSLLGNIIVHNPSANKLQRNANTVPSSLQQAAAPKGEEEADLFCHPRHIPAGGLDTLMILSTFF